MAFKLSTLHIFGYGETQVIGKDGDDSVNKKVSTSTVAAAAQAVVDNVFAQKPADNPSPNDFHAVNLFQGMFADFQVKGKDNKSFRVKWDKIDEPLVNALVAAVLAQA